MSDQKQTPPEDEGRKAYEQLMLDLSNDISRLRRNPPKTVDALAGEVHGTVMAFMADLAKLLLEQRDYLVEAVDVLSGQIEDLGEPEGLALDDEDANKLKSYVLATRALIARSIEITESEDALKELHDLAQLSLDCEQIVDSLTDLEEDDEDEDDDGSEGETEDSDPDPSKVQ